MRTTYTILIVCCLATGCASYQYNTIPRSSNSSVPYELSVGDDVKIWTERTGEIRFKVEKVTETAVYGEGYEISFQEIQGASKKQLDEWQTTYDTQNAVGYSFIAVVVASGIMLILGLSAL